MPSHEAGDENAQPDPGHRLGQIRVSQLLAHVCASCRLRMSGMPTAGHRPRRHPCPIGNEPQLHFALAHLDGHAHVGHSPALVQHTADQRNSTFGRQFRMLWLFICSPGSIAEDFDNPSFPNQDEMNNLSERHS